MQFTTPSLTIAFYMHSVPFTRAVCDHETSLGGSESACRVLAEALAARGHDVHIFATQLETPGEYFGVQWHPAELLDSVLQFSSPDVFVSLRMPHVFQQHRITAKLRVLWNQDLLIDDAFIGQLYALDQTVYVSKYHREQWCNIQPILRKTAWVTRNPIDPADLEQADIGAIAKIPKRLIHVSRPERGHDGLLALWPEIRKRHSDATLAVCRYDSMYDKAGWGEVCAAYDRKIATLHEQVGGVEILGGLNKHQLYQAIAMSVGMLYPTTQDGFAETNCVAATEAQACGTPIIASSRGAMPETVAPGAGVLIDGDVLNDPGVQIQFVEAVDQLFAAAGSADDPRYETMRVIGKAHAARSFGPAVAQDWEWHLMSTFSERYAKHKLAVMRQLLHWDQHVHARLVAEDILAESVGEPIVEGTAADEAQEAWELCGRVIRQEEQTAEQYAKYAVQDPKKEAAENGRMHAAADRLLANLGRMREAGQLVDRQGQPRAPRILDVSCGNGSMAIVLAERLPDATIHGIDYSDGVIQLARTATEQYGRRVRFWAIDNAADAAGLEAHLQRHNDGERYDAVFCGEFVEHIEKPWELLDSLEAVVQPDGFVVLTTPCGPFAELLTRGIPRQRGHVHAFSDRDLKTMCRDKREFGWSYLGMEGRSARGNAAGYWLFGFRPGGGPAQPIDYLSTILTERPYQRLNAAMIVKDGAQWLRKCLDSIYGVVDRTVVVDFGSTDGSADLARDLGADVVERPWPEDFSVARNLSLDLAQPDAEWILWIDADEHVDRPQRVRDYVVDGGIFVGYVVRQRHLAADQPAFDDKPVRLFRTGHGARFYGVVHEQPELVMNEGLTPALDQQDFRLIHFGYEDEPTRRWKMKERNLPLLMKELTGHGTHPPRTLAWILYLRDCAILATWEVEAHKGKRTPTALLFAQRAIATYHDRGFADAEQNLLNHELAWPYYQQALKVINQGVEVAWTFAAAPGRLDLTRVKPEVRTFRAGSLEEVTYLTTHQISRWTKALEPRVVDIEPYFEMPTFAGLTADKVRSIVRDGAPATFTDDRRIYEWAALFCEVMTQGPEGREIDPVLEVGTERGATAFVWLKLLEALKLPGVPVITVDPHSAAAPAAPTGTDSSGDTFVAMKKRLASFRNHYHFPIAAQRFLSPSFVKSGLIWSRGRQIDLDRFSFVLLDGQHAADTIVYEMDCLLGRRSFGTPMLAQGAIVVIDHVDADTQAALERTYPAITVRPAKWSQKYAVLRMPLTAEVPAAIGLQASALKE